MRSLSLLLVLAASVASAQNPARVLITGDSLLTDSRGLRYVQAGDTVRVDAKVYATNGTRVGDPRLTWTPTNANTKLVGSGPSFVRLTALATGTVAVKAVWQRNDAQRPSATASYQALTKIATAVMDPAEITVAERDSILLRVRSFDATGREVMGRVARNWTSWDTTTAVVHPVPFTMTAWVVAKSCGALCAGRLGVLRGTLQKLTWYVPTLDGSLKRAGT